MASDGLHSADLLGPTRDFWWNDDFVALMAQRWGLDSIRSALDVGSGLGHWGRTLLPYLHPGATIVGIDSESRWVAEAAARAAEAGVGARLRYACASAEQLSFPDAAFDLVTCQTLLVHVADVRRTLGEMTRVLRPGGLLAAVEPNNLALSLLLGQTRVREDPDVTLALVRLQLVCERGKEALGEGYNSVGDLLPGYFDECGLRDIAVYQSDHATPLIPPYDDPAQRSNRDELIDLADRGMYIWTRAEAERYWRAGGGSPGEFEALWAAAMDVAEALKAGLLAETEHQAGGSALYLVSGRKRAG